MKCVTIQYLFAIHRYLCLVASFQWSAQMMRFAKILNVFLQIEVKGNKIASNSACFLCSWFDYQSK